MDDIKKILLHKWTLVTIALIVGIALGVVYAWLINPVEWVDGVPSQLRWDLQVDYLRMVIDSYSMNLDSDLAKLRYENLGESRGNVLSEIGEDPGEVSAAEIQRFQALMAVESPTISTPQPDNGGTDFKASKYILPVCGATFVLGTLLVGAFLLKRRMEGGLEEEVPAEHGYQEVVEAVVVDAVEVQPAEQPLATFRTTYTIGDNLYDDSFSIESAAGDFLGECGVGIGEVIGVEDPKKVSAFEVWLFDKNDIQTVTKVLMSHYAFSDEDSRTRLAAKGDPVQAESGGVIALETASLRIEVRVVDLSYGSGPLPANSFFDRLTVELKAWQV